MSLSISTLQWQPGRAYNVWPTHYFKIYWFTTLMCYYVFWEIIVPLCIQDKILNRSKPGSSLQESPPWFIISLGLTLKYEHTKIFINRLNPCQITFFKDLQLNEDVALWQHTKLYGIQTSNCWFLLGFFIIASFILNF